MSYFKKVVQELKKKTLARIKRAEVLAKSADLMDRKKANEMIAAQRDEILTWDKERIIAEFIDPGELLIREVLKRMNY